MSVGKTFASNHDFPGSFGFSGSAGKITVKSHVRGPRAPTVKAVAPQLTAKAPRQHTPQSPQMKAKAQPFQDYKRGGPVKSKR
jgi:hypothetical protein